MKVLLVDAVCWKEHVSYNNYWIRALNALNVQYDLACINGYSDLLHDANPGEIFELDGTLGSSGFKMGRNILNQLFRMIDYMKYNYIVFTTVNKMAFVSSPFFTRSKCIIISHVWQSKIGIWDRLLYKLLSRRHVLGVLDGFLKEWLDKESVQTKEIVHPIPTNVKKIMKPFHERKEFTIFSPSKSVDSNFLSELVSNRDVNDWLFSHGIKIIIRSDKFDNSSSNIRIISGFIPNEEYDKLFIEANSILIAYPETFKTRVSNVFYEAIGAKKNILLKKGTHLDEYVGYFGKEGIYPFTDLDSFKGAVESLINSKAQPKFQQIEQYHSIENMTEQVRTILGM